jgi:hypothetical protein
MGGEKQAAISSEWKMTLRGGDWQSPSGTKVWPPWSEDGTVMTHIVVVTIRAAAGNPQISSVL